MGCQNVSCSDQLSDFVTDYATYINQTFLYTFFSHFEYMNKNLTSVVSSTFLSSFSSKCANLVLIFGIDILTSLSNFSNIIFVESLASLSAKSRVLFSGWPDPSGLIGSGSGGDYTRLVKKYVFFSFMKNPRLF